MGGRRRRTRRGGAQLAEHPNRFLSTVQIGITLIGIVTGFYGGATLSEPVARFLARVPAIAPYSQSIAVVLVVGLVTYLSLLVGELVPKRLALQNPERIAMAVAQPMNLLSKIAASSHSSALRPTSSCAFSVCDTLATRPSPKRRLRFASGGAAAGVFAQPSMRWSRESSTLGIAKLAN